MGLTHDQHDRFRYWMSQYELLEEPWLSYGRIARHYAGKADPEDREDLVQDIVLALAQAAHKVGALSPWLMLTIAKHAWVNYLRNKRKYSRFCSLNQPVKSDEPQGKKMWELLPDDKALDLDAWAHARRELEAFPQRVLQVAAKRAGGEALTVGERSLLLRCRERGGPPHPTSPGLERFAHIIREKVAEGWGSYRIWRELHELGYQGSLGAVKYFLGGEKARERQRVRDRLRLQRASGGRANTGPRAA